MAKQCGKQTLLEINTKITATKHIKDFPVFLDTTLNLAILSLVIQRHRIAKTVL